MKSLRDRVAVITGTVGPNAGVFEKVGKGLLNDSAVSPDGYFYWNGNARAMSVDGNRVIGAWLKAGGKFACDPLVNMEHIA